MKGQYFSFDAIIATVIMVLAVTSLVAYWYGAQSVIESRTSPLYSDSLRVAESLLSPGVPANWSKEADAGNWGVVKQIGLGTGFGNELDLNKVKALQKYSDPSLQENEYSRIAALLRAGGYQENYYILLQQSDEINGKEYLIGKQYPANASEVEIADRGATLDTRPYRLRVFLWRD